MAAVGLALIVGSGASGPAGAATVREGELLGAFVALEDGSLSVSEARDACILTLPFVSAGDGLRL